MAPITPRRRSQRRRVRHRTLPVWVAAITEVVHVNGKRYANVVTRKGNPRTIELQDEK